MSKDIKILKSEPFKIIIIDNINKVKPPSVITSPYNLTPSKKANPLAMNNTHTTNHTNINIIVNIT